MDTGLAERSRQHQRRENTAPSAATNFWEVLCVPAVVLAVGLLYQVTLEKNHGVPRRA